MYLSQVAPSLHLWFLYFLLIDSIIGSKNDNSKFFSCPFVLRIPYSMVSEPYGNFENPPSHTWFGNRNNLTAKYVELVATFNQLELIPYSRQHSTSWQGNTRTLTLKTNLWYTLRGSYQKNLQMLMCRRQVSYHSWPLSVASINSSLTWSGSNDPNGMYKIFGHKFVPNYSFQEMTRRGQSVQIVVKVVGLNSLKKLEIKYVQISNLNRHFEQKHGSTFLHRSQWMTWHRHRQSVEAQ